MVGPEFAEYYIPQLAMCETMSIINLLGPSLAHHCETIQNFVLVDLFDSQEKTFNIWWDANVVPLIDEFYQTLTQEAIKHGTDK